MTDAKETFQKSLNKLAGGVDLGSTRKSRNFDSERADAAVSTSAGVQQRATQPMHQHRSDLQDQLKGQLDLVVELACQLAQANAGEDRAQKEQELSDIRAGVHSTLANLEQEVASLTVKCGKIEGKLDAIPLTPYELLSSFDILALNEEQCRNLLLQLKELCPNPQSFEKSILYAGEQQPPLSFKELQLFLIRMQQAAKQCQKKKKQKNEKEEAS